MYLQRADSGQRLTTHEYARTGSRAANKLIKMRMQWLYASATSLECSRGVLEDPENFFASWDGRWTHGAMTSTAIRSSTQSCRWTSQLSHAVAVPRTATSTGLFGEMRKDATVPSSDQAGVWVMYPINTGYIWRLYVRCLCFRSLVRNRMP
ncbi:hypothetical protein BD413DRAFT_112860 [Trametes elegans]|nr:hypothetical protein BD413DRAFT_112860 [Trametes elegans]